MRTYLDKIFRPEHNQDYVQFANFFYVAPTTGET